MRWLATALLLVGCSSEDPARSPPPDVAPGIFAPLGEPRPSATSEEREAFERGREAAAVRATPEGGLGPTFNATSCAACHERPVPGGGAGRYRDFLLDVTASGETAVQPQYTLDPIGRAPTPGTTTATAKRHAVPLFGVGLLAEIPEEEILRRADPLDSNHDGIRGRANLETGFVGRFGRKAQLASIEAFVRAELLAHVGLTSDPLGEDEKASLPVAEIAPEAFPIGDADAIADPELGARDLADLVEFTMLLAAPEPAPPTAETAEGRDRFEAAGCTACHVPALDGPRGLIPAYSDLLVHDMGPALADQVSMGHAEGSDFRTQPLWGIAAVGPYLHDGRADTLSDAIGLHGGEAAPARDAYLAMSEDGRRSVVAFLESLGGKAQASPGLLPPGAPVPDPGELGGPLPWAERSAFHRGRAVFDRDVPVVGGLGGRFNGDSCRACHFQPVIGGAGPKDVDVCRHGIFDPATGVFTPAGGGTMAFRHGLGEERPPIDPAANVFELRQTPALFGLGLIERIPAASILARQDPDDLDGDGISGRAHVLPDGRLGRFGWKANVPSLREFARDATFNELGVTLPPEAGQTFGAETDEDAIADPEIQQTDLADLVSFLEALGPPPRTAIGPMDESAGQAIFADIGCASCHTPEMATDDGGRAQLYSDLLLHDVAPRGARGIPTGEASAREFRTPPLWGIHDSAPYMHDGRAATLSAAIAGHDAEARNARLAFERLGGADRKRLLAFLGSL